MIRVSSFDVFDTVLTRWVGDPDAVLTLTGESLEHADGLPMSAVAFKVARKHQEQRLTRLWGRHATLREIYREVARSFSVEECAAEVWAAAEEDAERSLTVPVPEGQRLVTEARARGDRVVFVSDTPHTEDFLTELLTAHQLARPEDRVFTSAERRCSKSQGGLFSVVAAELGTGHAFVHRGDNRRGDVGAARLEGWQAEWHTAAALTKYEKALEAYAAETASFTSYLAGASRIARLEARERGLMAARADVASGVLGPLLVGYALWVVAQARLRGISRLYYVARDGEVMLEAARHIIGRLAPDIELRYLYGSRQAWTFGACALSDEVLAGWARAQAGHSARTALIRLGLTPEQVYDETRLAWMSAEHADDVLTSDQRQELADRLQQEPLRSLVRQAAAGPLERATAYLVQEGLCDGVRSALVDAGWSGRTAKAFDRILAAAGAGPVTHFVLGITGTEDDRAARADVDLVPWLFDQQQNPDSVAGLQSPNVVVEMLCAGTEGRTLDYRSDPGAFVPVLQTERNDPVIEWGLPAVQAVALDVAELVAAHVPQDARSVDCSTFVWDVLRAFWTHPSDAEVAHWADFPWEEEVAQPYQPIATRISTGTFVERWRRGDRSLRRNNSWRAGTAVRSAQPWRSVLRLRAWQDENRERIGRIPRRIRLELHQRRP